MKNLVVAILSALYVLAAIGSIVAIIVGVFKGLPTLGMVGGIVLLACVIIAMIDADKSAQRWGG